MTGRAKVAEVILIDEGGTATRFSLDGINHFDVVHRGNGLATFTFTAVIRDKVTVQPSERRVIDVPGAEPVEVDW